MFYYVALAMTGAALVISHLLLRSRIGYCWLAIRESPDAAQALGINVFRYHMYAVVLSAAMSTPPVAPGLPPIAPIFSAIDAVSR